MADFAAVLKKTLDGMGETTPASRQRVYEKARQTVAAKLAAINPPPPSGVADRQRQALEDAIKSIEKGYASKSDPLSELEDVFASLKNPQPRPQTTPLPPPAAPAPRQTPPPLTRPVSPAMPRSAPPAPPAGGMARATPPATAPRQPAVAPQPARQPVRNADPRLGDPRHNEQHPGDRHPGDRHPKDPRHNEQPVNQTALRAAPQPSALGPEMDDDAPAEYTRRRPEPAVRKRSYGPLLVAAVLFAVIAGGGYGIWLNRDAFGGLFGGDSQTAGTNAPGTATGDGSAPAGEQPASDTTPAPASEAPKFTQRLTPEGSETDPGPANGGTTVGEGTSVSTLTQPPVLTPPMSGQPDATGEAEPATGEQPAAGADAAVAVAQKAIFYEERTSASEGSAEPGTTVWSLVQESPGNDLPPEPAIRAEASVPGKDIKLRMTIKRNADQSLPASHIIEMIFLTPEGFPGGGVDNILRVAMKGSEQEAGNPLIGIPAKIADGFFLVALNDGKAETDANLTLLRRQSWIDIPVVYKSGRRALFTMEKGAPGDKVFDEALKAWAATAATSSPG